MNRVDGLETIGRIPLAQELLPLIQRRQVTVYALRHEGFGKQFLFLQPFQCASIAFALCEDEAGTFRVVLADGRMTDAGASLLSVEHLTLAMEKSRLQSLQVSLADAIKRGMATYGIRALVVAQRRGVQKILGVQCGESLEALRTYVPSFAAMSTMEARYKLQGY